MIDTLSLNHYTEWALRELRLTIFQDNKDNYLYFINKYNQTIVVLAEIPNNECLEFYLRGRMYEKMFGT